jgi:hypothetical protein
MNSAIAKQNGVANESTQTQRDKNTASVNQDGHKNVAIKRTMTIWLKEVKLLFTRKVCII